MKSLNAWLTDSKWWLILNIALHSKGYVLADTTTTNPDGAEIALPSLDDVKNLFREKCVNVSGSEAAYEKAIEGSKQFVQCAAALVNVTELNNEIEAAKPIGELDTVFQK